MLTRKIGQPMQPGPLKSALIAILTLMLSVGHSACAGMISDVAAPSTEQHESLSHHHAEISDVHGSDGHQEHHGGTSHAPCGPDGSDCHHCNAAQFYKSASKIEFAAPPAWSPHKLKTYAETGIETRIIGKTTLSRLAFHWRGPPAMTPVTMKTRLLN